MSDQYLGEIRMTGFNFAPQGWALCNGQTLPISAVQRPVCPASASPTAVTEPPPSTSPICRAAFPSTRAPASVSPPPSSARSPAPNPLRCWPPTCPVTPTSSPRPVSSAAGTASTPVNGFPAVDAVTAAPPIERTTFTAKSYAASSSLRANRRLLSQRRHRQQHLPSTSPLPTWSSTSSSPSPESSHPATSPNPH